MLQGSSLGLFGFCVRDTTPLKVVCSSAHYEWTFHPIFHLKLPVRRRTMSGPSTPSSPTASVPCAGPRREGTSGLDAALTVTGSDFSSSYWKSHHS